MATAEMMTARYGGRAVADPLARLKREFARRRAELTAKGKLTIRERLDLDSLAGSVDEACDRAFQRAIEAARVFVEGIVPEAVEVAREFAERTLPEAIEHVAIEVERIAATPIGDLLTRALMFRSTRATRRPRPRAPRRQRHVVRLASGSPRHARRGPPTADEDAADPYPSTAARALARGAA